MAPRRPFAAVFLKAPREPDMRNGGVLVIAIIVLISVLVIASITHR